MWLSDISVRRPLVAVVLSALLTVFGLVAFSKLTVREMPDVQTPSVSITTMYEGPPRRHGESGHQAHRGSALRHQRHQEHQLGDPQGRAQSSRWSSSSAGTWWRISDARCHLRARPKLPDEVDEPLVTKDNGNGDVAVWLNFSSTQMDRTAMTDYANRVLVDPPEPGGRGERGVALRRSDPGDVRAAAPIRHGGARRHGGGRAGRPQAREHRGCRAARSATTA